MSRTAGAPGPAGALRIAHTVQATIDAPVDTVWALLGSFGDLSWNPGVRRAHLLDHESAHVGSVREMHLADGSVVRERLDALGPGHRFTYSFDGTPPIPVSRSSTTVTAATAGDPARGTAITWHGEYDVADHDTARQVEHVNLDLVWPASIGALAAALGVDHTLGHTVGRTDDTSTHPRTTLTRKDFSS